MRNLTSYTKIILIFLAFLVLFANISFADERSSKASETISKIDNGHNHHSKSSETIEQIEVRQKSPSNGKPIPILIVNATVDPTKIYRGNCLEITYIFKSQSSNLPLDDVIINVPEEFENIECANKSYLSKSLKNPHEIHLAGTLFKDTPLKIILKASVPLSGSLKKYNISKLVEYEKIIFTPNMTLEVQNNPPKILELHVESNPDKIYEDLNTSTCFAESNIAFAYNIVDEEKNGIIFNISINDSQLWNRSTNDYSSNIEYGKITPGNYLVNISIRDRDGAEHIDRRYIKVTNKTYKQDFAEKFLPNIIFIVILLIICLLIFRSKEILCLNIKVLYWHTIKKILIAFCVIWLLIPYVMGINFLTYILVIYFLVSILAIGLVDISFSGSPKSMCHLPNINRIKKLLYIISKSTLTLAVIFCMTIAVLIVGFSLPSNFSSTGMDTHFSYIFYYYSAIVQLFGTILSIVAMFAIWYMQDYEQESGLLESKPDILEMLKEFMSLYISVILLSLCGLALERLPDLDVVGKIDSIASSSVVFIFETTMLLATPAMVALYRMATRFMEKALAKRPSTKEK